MSTPDQAGNPASPNDDDLALVRFVCPVCVKRGGTVERGCYGCGGAGTIALASDRADGQLVHDEVKTAFTRLREQAADATATLVETQKRATIAEDTDLADQAHATYAARIGEHATGTLPAINAAELVYLAADLAALPAPAQRLVAVRHDLQAEGGLRSDN